MRHWILIGTLALAAPAFAAEESRDLPPFQSIRSQGAYTLTVTAGQKQSVVVQADPSILPHIHTQVRGDELVISMPEYSNHDWVNKIHISINVARLNVFRMEGAGDTTLSHMSGPDFSLRYQGVGALRVSGKVGNFSLRAEGLGSINARDLVAQQVDASLQGIGAVEVTATDSLNAKVEGIGALTYYGKPAHVHQSAQGIGTVQAGD